MPDNVVLEGTDCRSKRSIFSLNRCGRSRAGREAAADQIRDSLAMEVTTKSSKAWPSPRDSPSPLRLGGSWGCFLFGF